MCWVMPPASPAATRVLRIASMSVVLPWSTWPMKVTIGARAVSSSGFGFGNSFGGALTTSTLWTPPPSLRFSRSKVSPCFVQMRAATSGSIDWLIEAKMFISIRSPINWNGFKFIAVARSLTVKGGLRWMTFSSVGTAGVSTTGSAGEGCVASTTGATGSSTGSGTTTAGLGASGARMREMGILLSNGDAVRTVSASVRRSGKAFPSRPWAPRAPLQESYCLCPRLRPWP